MFSLKGHKYLEKPIGVFNNNRWIVCIYKSQRLNSINKTLIKDMQLFVSFCLSYKKSKNILIEAL